VSLTNYRRWLSLNNRGVALVNAGWLLTNTQLIISPSPCQKVLKLQVHLKNHHHSIFRMELANLELEEPKALTRQILIDSIVQRANRTSQNVALDAVSDALQRASERRRAESGDSLEELQSLDVSAATARREYKWDDLVAGTHLPTPYYNPEDHIIRLDESSLYQQEAKDTEADINSNKRSAIESKRLPPGSKKLSKQGMYICCSTITIFIMMKIIPNNP
jgi:hypothetical protein